MRIFAVMGLLAVTTPFNIDLEFQTAPFGRRLMAWFLDIIIICLYYYLMMRFVFNMFSSTKMASSGEIFLVLIPVLLYQPVMEIFFDGQSLGKKLVGIKVIDVNGQEPTTGQFITRWMLSIGNLFLYIVPFYILTNPFLFIFFLVFYLPDVITVAVSAKSQRLSDLAAGTVVIDNRNYININETIYLPVDALDYQPLFPQVMRLTDRDINGIRNLLEAKPTKDMDTYTDQVAYRIKDVLHIEHSIENGMVSHDFLKQLLKDYNYLTQH
jgi:uncharacterized RDD family membrane protein YckC